MKKLLFLATFVFLTAPLPAQSFTTPPPATAAVGTTVTISGSAPVVNNYGSPPGSFSFLLLWVQTPDGTWTHRTIGSSATGTMTGTSGVTLTAATGSSSGVWHFAIGAVLNSALPATNAAPTNPHANATTTVGTPITAASIAALTYTGSAQSPTAVSSVTPSGATVTVSAPAQTNAGTYATATVTGTGNYSGTLSNVSWTINPATQPGVTITSATSITYGNAYTATATGGSGTGAWVWALGSGSTAPGAAIHTSTGAVTASGTGTVVIKAQRAGDANHSASAWTANFTVTVNPRPITVTLGGSKTYDGGTGATGATASITAGSLAAGDAVSYAYAGTSSPNAGTYAGLATATVTNGSAPTARTGSYAISYAGTYAISRAAITAATLPSFTYTGSAQAPTTVSGVTPAGATVTVSASAQTNAGTYATATVTGTGNYSGTLSNVSWTIGRAAITAATLPSFTYNGSAQAPTSVSSITPAGATVTVSASPQTNAGTYATATVAGTGNYTGTLANLSWTIHPQAITAAAIAPLGYNGSAQAPTTVSSVTPAGATVTVSASAQTNAGTYTATVTGTGNYTGTLSNVSWSIIQATTQAVTSLDGNVTFGQPFTPSISGYFGTGANQWTVSGQFGFTALGPWTAPAADSYSFQVRNVGDTNYAASTSGTYTLTVAPASPSGTFAARTLTLASGATRYFVTASDLNAGFANPTSGSVAPPTGALSYTIASGSPDGTVGAAVTAGTALPPGTYHIRANYPGDANYTSASVTATWLVVLPSSVADQLGLDHPDSPGQADSGNATGLKVNQPQ